MRKLLKTTFMVLRSWLRGRIFPSLRSGEVNSLSYACILLSGEYRKYALNLFGLAARAYDISKDEFCWMYFDEKWSAPTSKDIFLINEKNKSMGFQEIYKEALGYVVVPVSRLRNPQ